MGSDRMRLPHADKALIEREKIIDYLLCFAPRLISAYPLEAKL
jgi:hypothetical protein